MSPPATWVRSERASSQRTGLNDLEGGGQTAAPFSCADIEPERPAAGRGPMPPGIRPKRSWSGPPPRSRKGGVPCCGAGFPGCAGVPPASGPQAHPCVQAGKPAPAWGRRGMPALPAGRPPERTCSKGEIPRFLPCELPGSKASPPPPCGGRLALVVEGGPPTIPAPSPIERVTDATRPPASNQCHPAPPSIEPPCTDPSPVLWSFPPPERLWPSRPSSVACNDPASTRRCFLGARASSPQRAEGPQWKVRRRPAMGESAPARAARRHARAPRRTMDAPGAAIARAGTVVRSESRARRIARLAGEGP